jgi:hypothetical protein
VWSRPGRTQQYLLPSSASFILPAAITTAVCGLCVYHGFYLATDDGLQARTALTIASTLCGLIVLPFVLAEAGARGLPHPDFRLTMVSLAMLALLAGSLAIPFVHRFYEFEALTPAGYAAILAAVALWAALLGLIWAKLPLFLITGRRPPAEADAAAAAGAGGIITPETKDRQA